MSDRDEDHKAVVLAQGKALAILSVMLERDRPFRAREYGEYLGTFAAITGEVEHREATILASWSDIVMELANTISRSPGMSSLQG
ncbi:hypothetical protein [Novosphingobium album (ex Liu et al. 2023)]|uniref:Uncharacterized protein n=1 Tax=Novosphingobium album (ex Liu et al. 2023) TaxID=3031130 RepID=A0ABT5WQ48_9SPHN|nr:hypothetical protein [Novosphingobium album (ex Liu et al. 2023)]MDE8652143.1 hypothetical protein [Novosphingobium album (ex Liu et al. 2023)]